MWKHPEWPEPVYKVEHHDGEREPGRPKERCGVLEWDRKWPWPRIAPKSCHSPAIQVLWSSKRHYRKDMWREQTWVGGMPTWLNLFVPSWKQRALEKKLHVCPVPTGASWSWLKSPKNEKRGKAHLPQAYLSMSGSGDPHGVSGEHLGG